MYELYCDVHAEKASGIVTRTIALISAVIVRTIIRFKNIVMASGQAVRLLILDQIIVGSNPTSPAKKKDSYKWVFFLGC